MPCGQRGTETAGQADGAKQLPLSAACEPRPGIAPGTDVAAPTVAVSNRPLREMAKTRQHPGKADGGVGADRAKWVGADEPGAPGASMRRG
jgi:hypothetical protein